MSRVKNDKLSKHFNLREMGGFRNMTEKGILWMNLIDRNRNIYHWL